jgi:hypothetical protein
MKTVKLTLTILLGATAAYAGDGIFDNIRADGVPVGSSFYYPSLEVKGRGGMVLRGTGEGSTNSYNLTSSFSNVFVYDSGLSSVSLGDIYLGSFTGRNSLVVGTNNVLTGNSSLAAGSGASAAALASVALNSADVTATYATAVNDGSASGSYAFAQGIATAASAYSTAIGQYNTTVNYSGGAVSASSWAAADPVFNIGIGTGTSARKDALIVYKGGQVKIPKRQGDIIMGEFGNGGGD